MENTSSHAAALAATFILVAVPGAAIAAGGDSFSISFERAAVSVVQGSSVQVKAYTDTNSGPTQTVDLEISGLPSGITATLAPARLTVGEQTTLTLTASQNAPTPYLGDLYLKATGDRSTSEDSLSLNIYPPGDQPNEGCPVGTTRAGGLCLPDGCGSSGKSTFWAVGALGLLLLASRRRTRVS